MRKGALIDAIKIARGDAGTSTKAAVKAASGPAVDTTAATTAAPLTLPDTAVEPKAEAEAPASADSTAVARSGRSAMLVSPTRASLIVPPSTLTVAAIATMAHWWATRTNFS